MNATGPLRSLLLYLLCFVRLIPRFRLQGVAAGLVLALSITPIWAATSGRATGSITDSTGAVVVGAKLTLTDVAQNVSFTAITDRRGAYVFPNLPVATYNLRIEAAGFADQRREAIKVNAGSALQLDVALELGTAQQTVTVTSSDTAVLVERSATDLGEVVSGTEMTAIPLNGRSYTDLLAIQPGVAPVSTLRTDAVVMAGVTGAISPSGDLNAGNLSINGQRESSNGFLVNGIDVQEHMNGGTSVVPDLDSIDEFRVFTNNFDPEYGNYNGGLVTVVTKAGSNNLHGTGYEFFRNTSLDARGYFDPTRSAFNQNQYGGTLGGHIRKDKLFFFADYQGTRTTQGVSTGQITVPTLNERAGNFSDSSGNSRFTAANGNPTTVSGPYLASILSQRLGYTVTPGEDYSQVFQGGIIPQSAWSAPAKFLLNYIPAPNVSGNDFSTSAYNETVRDDKGSVRMDLNTHLGTMSGYYFIDDYKLDNPYPGNVAGASIPGFDALTIGRAQLFSVQHNKSIGDKFVSEFHAGVMRFSNIIGQPNGGTGITVQQQGFASGDNGGPGIYIQAPQFEGVENIVLPSFTMGVPITNMTQWNNELFVSEGFSAALGAQVLKFGAQVHWDQVNTHPNGTFNGTYNIDGTETGQPFADFLIGVPSNYTQSAGPPFYLRNKYFALYAEDSWRVRSDLTLNLGTRWDVIQPWSEKYNRIQTYVKGEQSVLYPGAPPGLVMPGDPGIPDTIAPTQWANVVPRIGIAWSPASSDGPLQKVFGKSGDSSIRASFGMFYTAFPGLTAGIMYAVPPFGYNYLSPAPPLFETPFITAATGANNGQRFPVTLPAASVSRSNPDTSVNWSNYVPLSADPFLDSHTRVPYTESYMLSAQRQITQAMLLTVSYAGNQGHRVMALVSVNPGNPALCLSLPGCGPFGEDSTYTDAHGDAVQGTRVGQGPLYGENTSDNSIANSNYNALESTLRYNHNGSRFLFSYTYAKSIDQGSSLGEQLDPNDARQTRAISAWDQKHSFVATYTYALPFESIFQRRNLLTQDWSVSGNTRFATGFPITFFDTSDNSLLGTLGNGVNNYLLDTPQFTSGDLQINHNGRNGRPAFNTSLFSEEPLGVLGNSKRRMFYGPGIENFDLTLSKSVRLPEDGTLLFRLEAFNAFNHAQFYGGSSVEGHYGVADFGQIVQAASPRLVQLVAKFNF